MKKFTIKDKALRCITVLLMIGIWHGLFLLVDNPVLVPSPASTLESFIGIASKPGFYVTVMYTTSRSIGGVFTALVLAVIFGGLSRNSGLGRFFFRPVVNFLSSVPVIAIILLAIIWLESSVVPIFVGFLVVFPIMYENVLSSLDGIDQGIVQMAKVYKVKKTTLLRDIYIPAIMFGFSDISSTTISTTLKMVVAGEVLSQPEFSIGTNLQIQRIYLNTSGVFGWIVVILIVSKLLNALVGLIKSHFDSREWM